MPIVEGSSSIRSSWDWVLNFRPISLHESPAGITAIEKQLLLKRWSTDIAEVSYHLTVDIFIFLRITE
jgi:hypothetical protein